MTLLPLTIPSPTVGAWHLGPLLVRGYAVCILIGIIAAIWIAQRRLEARGGRPGQVVDIAAYAVPAGIVGGRLYHVITTPQPYFGANGNPVDALKIWQGGLGIWGAIAVGALGAWWGCRRSGVSFLAFADSAAPGVAVAQAIGRWGNWFNNELYGRPTELPWGLTIHQWDQAAARAVTDADGTAVVLGTFHPTFLYESLFLLVLAGGLLFLDRIRTWHPGQILAMYVAGYPLGRVVVELMRSDPANTILGLRVNVWTSAVVFVLGLVIFRLAGRRPSEASDRADPAGLGGAGTAEPVRRKSAS